MTANQNNVKATKNSSSVCTPANEMGKKFDLSQVENFKEFISKPISITETGEYWIWVIKGLNLMSSISGAEIANEGFFSDDLEDYSVALNFIRELNSEILNLSLKS